MTNSKVIPRLAETAYTNEATENDYFNRLMLLAVSEFEWVNLPETCDERFIELGLFKYGKMCFCQDKRYGLISPQCTYANYDIYGNPVEISPIVPYGAISYDEKKGFVLIRNNSLNVATIDTVSLFARRLSRVERVLDTTINNLKKPFIISTTKDNKETLERIWKQVDDNVPAITVDKSLGLSDNKLNSIAVLSTNAQNYSEELYHYKLRLWGEICNLLGLNSVQYEKKERLNLLEVESNNEQIDMTAETMLYWRRKAAEECNKKFGTEISVRMRKRTIADTEFVDKSLNLMKE